MTVDGPAIVRMNHTTVAIPPEDECEIDQYDNYVIDIGGE